MSQPGYDVSDRADVRGDERLGSTALIVTLDPEQVRLLEQAGYRWLATTDVWINQKTNRAVSSETVGRHTRGWLVRWLKGEITRGATSTRAAAPRMPNRR